VNSSSIFLAALILTGLSATQVVAEEAPEHELIEVRGISDVRGGTKVVPAEPDAEHGVWDAAQALPFVSLSLRSPAAVQQDLSLMGGTFEESGVMFDGIELGDPQTAHHDLDVALIPAETAYFELIPAGSGYGGGALAGALNIGLKVPQGASVSVWGGDFGFARTYGHYGITSDYEGTVASVGGGFDYARSDGWRPGTEFDTVSAAISAESTGPGGTEFFRIGLSDKTFGAADFYAPYPSEERTNSEVMFMRHQSPAGVELPYELYAIVKRHEDLFILDRNNPSLSTAEHISLVSAAGAKARFDVATVMAEVRGENLDSSSLGDRNRTTGHVGLSFDYPEPGSGIGVSGGLDITNGTPKYDVAARGHIELDDEGLFTANLVFARTYRLPSMTELYYLTPSNIGDPNLKEEHAEQISVVVESEGMTASFFRRHAVNLIDWIKFNPTDPWQATNIGELTTTGAGLACQAAWKKGLVRVHAEYMTSDIPQVPYQSKYALRYIEKRIGASGTTTLGGGFGLEYGVEALKRHGWSDTPILADLFIVWCKSDVEVRAGGTNLFDKIYEDVPGADAPGRWLSAGMSYSW
jgi:iron complex outermembrane receptor protein